MKKIAQISGLAIFIVLFGGLLNGCGEEKSAPGAVRKTRPAQLVELVTARTQLVRHESQRTGTLRARKSVRIFNQEEGTLTALPFYEGDAVQQGDILLHIDDKLLRAEYDKANATLQQAQQDVDRLQKLRKKRLVAEDELNRARTALDVAQAEQKLLTTRLGYTSLASPITGIVSQRLAEPGDVAPRHTHLLTIIDTDTLITEVAISGLLVPSLSVGDEVDVRIDALNNQSFKGKIMRIHPTLDERTRNGIVEVILDPAPKSARPGQFCRVTIRSAAEPRILVPFTALRQDSDGSFVYVADKDKAVRRPVATGLRFDDHIEIIEGLTDNEQVVIKGFLGLKHGKKIRTVADNKQKS